MLELANETLGSSFFTSAPEFGFPWERLPEQPRAVTGPGCGRFWSHWPHRVSLEGTVILPFFLHIGGRVPGHSGPQQRHFLPSHRGSGLSLVAPPDRDTWDS